MKRIFLLTLLFLTIAIVGAIWYLSSTESGLKWMFARFVHLIPGDLSVKTLEGRLIGPMKINGLRYNADNYSITLDNLALEWRPIDLFFFDGTYHTI